MTRRWTAAVVLLACLTLAAPAVAACPGCCAPSDDPASFACAVSTGCGDCDPLLRPVLASERAALPHASVEGPAALPSGVLAPSPANPALTSARPVVSVSRATALSSGIPLRL